MKHNRNRLLSNWVDYGDLKYDQFDTSSKNSTQIIWHGTRYQLICHVKHLLIIFNWIIKAAKCIYKIKS